MSTEPNAHDNSHETPPAVAGGAASAEAQAAEHEVDREVPSEGQAEPASGEDAANAASPVEPAPGSSAGQESSPGGAEAAGESTPSDESLREEELPDAELEDEDDEDDEEVGDVEPLEFIEEPDAGDEEITTDWYILKVQVNREESIRDALQRRVKIEGLERYFGDIVVPTEDIAEFTKTGKRRIVKKKLYPGYIMVNMAINDDTWFVVRETPGIGDFTGSAGRPAPMDPADVERILKLGAEEDEDEQQVKTAIPFNVGDRVRVKDGYFQNFEGDVEIVDETHGRVTVMINIFGRPTPVELEHWQIELV